MNVKRIFLLIPTAMFPYIVLFALWLIFSNSQIMDTVFQGNAWLLIGAVFLFLALAFLLSFVAFMLCVFLPLNNKSLAKTVMVIKLAQIPAYVAIFILGAILMITIFTFPFSIALIFVDMATICMTGMMGTAVGITALRKKQLSVSNAIAFSVLQYIFCVDVVVSIITYCKLNK